MHVTFVICCFTAPLEVQKPFAKAEGGAVGLSALGLEREVMGPDPGPRSMRSSELAPMQIQSNLGLGTSRG
jgi:hypothetical protein